MKKLRVGINGFGRIGRSLTRVLVNRPEIELAMINDVATLETLAHLLKYDSVHGRFPLDISHVDGHLVIGDEHVRVSHQENPTDIQWQAEKIDVVIEATGRFKTYDACAAHLQNGVAQVILTAPPADESINMVVLGVNDHEFDFSQCIFSNASCTTNCAAPMIKLIDQKLGIESAYVTTVHSFTTDQKLHDSPHKDLRRARAATLSMVPTTTGAAKALSDIFPHLKGALGGCGIRVPVPDGSLTDITFHVHKNTSVDEVNSWFQSAAEGAMQSIVGYTEEPLVSADIIGLSNSVLFDAQLTSVLGKMVKIVGWYDNEMGYSHRLADVLSRVSR